MVSPYLRHPRRSQAEIPLIDLSEFGQPPLSDVDLFHHPMVLDGDGEAQRPDAFAATLCGSEIW